MIVKTGTKIWASLIERGMVIRTETDERVEVTGIQVGYKTITLEGMTGRPVTIAYDTRAEVLGYFNP